MRSSIGKIANARYTNDKDIRIIRVLVINLIQSNSRHS